MVFAYQGFTHDSGKRSFVFHSVEARVPAMAFSIEIDLRLFLQYKVSVQDGPSFWFANAHQSVDRRPERA